MDYFSYPGTPRMEDGKNLVCTLFRHSARFNLDSWYGTAEGGAYGVSSHPTSPIAKDSIFGDGRTVFLRDADEVAGWVRSCVAQFRAPTPGDPLTDQRLMAPTKLAIYPGFFTSEDSEERRCCVFRAFVEGIKESTGEAYGAAVVSLINGSFGSPNDGFLLHSFKHFPKPMVGLVAAHGYLYKQVWKKRHKEALTEASRYQLTHSDEKYYQSLSGFNGTPGKPLISSLFSVDRERLLDSSGLSEENVADAYRLANGVAEEGEHLHTQAVLLYLFRNSNLKDFDTGYDLGSLPPDLSGV